MSAPSEPEKYSIDEMMERLKNRQSEDPIQDGELVTRADGTQAIRVRKRKRRSQQPAKEERKQSQRARMIQVSGALILLLLGLFAAGAAVVFANSAGFRESLVKKISVSSGATVDLQQFRMNPTSANAGALTLAWPEGNALRDLTMRGLRAEISPMSFLGKSMVGEEVSSSEGTLTIRIPKSDKPSRDAADSGEIPSVRFKHYAIPKFHVLLGDSTAPLIRMLNSEASFHPINESGHAQLLLNHGDITIAGWPKLKMDRSHIEFRGTEVDVVGMRLHNDTDARGVFELSGTISPYSPDRASALSVQLESYPLAGIAGAEFGRLFSARIDTLSSAKSNYLSFTPGVDPNCSLAIEFKNSLASPFELNGFPFLFGLSQTLDDEWFARPVFEADATGAIRREDGKVTISGLNLENKGRMALHGSLTMAPDRRLSGNLEVGIADAMIKSALIKMSGSRRLDAMFGPSKEGFRWLTVKIGGGVGAPTDNFKELYEAATTKTAAEPESSKAIPSFEELTKPE